MKKKKLFSLDKFLVVFIFLFSIFICHFSGNRGVFPIDSFSHFDSGFRILNGEHPFKDYWLVSGFFVDYLQSLIFFLFGINWQTYILNASLLNGFVTILIYFVFNSLGLNYKLSFFYAICFSILAYPSSGTPFVDHRSSLLSIIALVFLINAMKTSKLIFWFLVPVFLFLAFLSKQVPATYIFIIVMISIILHLTQQSKNEIKKIILTLFISSSILIIFLLFFLYINKIEINLFYTQYLLYPGTIGTDRFKTLNYDFKNTFLNFKFIYLSLVILIATTFFILRKKDNFYTDLNFKITIVCILSFLSFAQHIIITKNQIFIFFLIPFFLGFANLQLNNLKINFKKYINFFLIIFCLGITLKYHYRFNVERKFHELNKVDFSQSYNAYNLSKKFWGLKWITPTYKTKKDITLEIQLIKNFINILQSDKNNKIVLSNYSFLSVLTDDNISGFSRWYPGDNSAFPIQGNKYYQNHKDFIISLLNKKKINSIYITPDISKNNLLDYINIKCLNKYELDFRILKYEINNKCPDIFIWKKK